MSHYKPTNMNYNITKQYNVNRKRSIISDHNKNHQYNNNNKKNDDPVNKKYQY